jgi:hypothetical protein
MPTVNVEENITQTSFRYREDDPGSIQASGYALHL